MIIYLNKIQFLITVFKRQGETLKEKVIADVLLLFGYTDFTSRPIGNKKNIARTCLMYVSPQYIIAPLDIFV